MSFSTATGVLTVGTGVATTTYAVTGLSFQPTCVLFWWTGQPSSGTDVISEIDLNMGFGVALGTSDRRCVFVQSDHGVGTSATDRAHYSSACVAALTTAGGVDGLADLQSFDSGGFTLVIDNAFAAGLRVSWLALGGTDLTNLYLGSITEPNATGSVSYSDAGFQPDAVLFFSTFVATAPDAISISCPPMLGAATAAAQAVMGSASNNNVANAQTAGYGISGECLATVTTAGVVARAALTAMTSTGFTLNWLASNSATRITHYLAIKGPSVKVGSFTTQTDTTTAMAQSGFGFQPSAVLLGSACRAASTAGAVTNPAEMSIGAFTSTSSRNAQAFHDEHGPTTMDIGVALEHDSIYANISADATKVIEGLMDVQSVDSGGFTAIMDDADPTANFVWYLALGPAAVAGGHPASKRFGGVPHVALRPNIW